MKEELPEFMPGNAEGLCDTDNGYYGVICASCLPGFKRKSKYGCQKCYKYENLYILGVLTAAVVLLVLSVRAVLKAAIKDENVQSVFAKILLNHIQMISITASFDMDWP